MHFCANGGFIVGAMALLDAGAHINIQTRMLETPLIIALDSDQYEMAQFLLRTRADVSKPGIRHVSFSLAEDSYIFCW